MQESQKPGVPHYKFILLNIAAELLDYGLYYPDTDNTFPAVIESGITTGNAYSLALLYQYFADNDDQLRLQTDQWIAKLIEKSNAYSFKTVVLSCETLSSLTRGQWAILEDALNEYFDLRLIAFFREPYSWVFSSWLQGIKRNGDRGRLGVGETDRDWLPLILPQMLSDRLLKKTVQLCYEECKSDIVGSFFKGN